MVGWFSQRRCGPIAIDWGHGSLKLLQLTADQSSVCAAAWVAFPGDDDPDPASRDAAAVETLRESLEAHGFRGRSAVICLGARELFVQNVRVPKTEESLAAMVRQEAASRLPFQLNEAELRYLEAGDVRQGDRTKREVIVMACRQAALDRELEIIERAGLRPVAVDAEPLALIRCYQHIYRREEDRHTAALLIHLGASNTVVIIVQGDRVLFIKYLDVGGRHFDESAARLLKMKVSDAALLRRHNGERRSDRQDPEIARTVSDAIRPVMDRLAGEISLCLRYHSVTFRGHKLTRMVLGGGEATPNLASWFEQRLDLPVEIAEPLRGCDVQLLPGRVPQWDVAAGMALRRIE